LNQSAGYNITCGVGEFHAKQCRFQYRWEILLKNRGNKKMEPCTRPGLSNHTTSTPILSGATVPLKA
jgi:hypothetical protein